ncbi:MAG: GNAT family N-acetyltransferase [Acidobacteria bacterium]|nr:GNAT family N-acetyltransferase [Acidobacteriota bacterium]
MSYTPQIAAPPLEILDIRHFSGAQLRPLLRDEAARWQLRLHWDYTRASNMLLDYLDSRILPGYVALQAGHIVGYAFCVFEGAKAVIGDIYAYGETEATSNPICDTLLHHLLELLHATPGIDRIESQLLMFPPGALCGPFRAGDFRSFSRLFMMRNLNPSSDLCGGVQPWHRRPSSAPGMLLQSWQPEFYESAAALIHRCYSGHTDADINDQYRTLHGAQRFLHNIIRFPGCGVFDAENSWVLRDPHTLNTEAILLCSRVRSDVNHITQLCVSPSLQGHGLGQSLLAHCAKESLERKIHYLSLTVTEANLAALQLYERNGFTLLHRFEAKVWDAFRNSV